MNYLKVGSGAVMAAWFAFTACAGVRVVTERNDDTQATGAFRFKNVPVPSRADAATAARFTVVDGAVDDNSGGLERLHDGKLPSEADEPAENFFFDAGTTGGRVLVDLGNVLDLEQVNTYSWHAGPRGPQVYKLYGSQGKGESFKTELKRPADPEKSGWKLLATVDTRPKSGEDAGQYGVSISDSDGSLGKWRYLLFDVSRTEDYDTFGNTFYSEIDVIEKGHAMANATDAVASTAGPAPFITHSSDGYCDIEIDTTGAPDLKDWAEQKLAPVLAEWYPKLTTILASDGFNAPKSFRVILKPDNGVAATGGTKVTANADWLRHELKGEAVGALLHEEVHVVQQYWRPRRERTQDFKPAPGWLVEGIPDYIRWFLYEPQSHGADLQWLKARRSVTLKYDARYRVTANFLDFVITHYDPKKELITKLNAACRQGKYTDELWSQCTGKSLTELDTEWRTTVEKQLAAERAGGAGGTGTAAPKS